MLSLDKRRLVMPFPSYIAGPFFMALGFSFCAIIVVGTKFVIIYVLDKIKEKFFSKKEELEDNDEEKATVKKLSVRHRKPKTATPVKSITVNTDDIDRIYFKKSS
jgi:hypothetical protein